MPNKARHAALAERPYMEKLESLSNGKHPLRQTIHLDAKFAAFVCDSSRFTGRPDFG